MLSAGTMCSNLTSAFRSAARPPPCRRAGRNTKSPSENCSVRILRKSSKRVGRSACAGTRSLRPWRGLVLRAAGLQHDGHVGNQLANHMRQLETGRRLQLAAASELHVRDDAGADSPCTSRPVRRRPHNRNRAAAWAGARKRSSLCATLMPSLITPSRLSDHRGVDHRQERGIIADVVLDNDASPARAWFRCRVRRCACPRCT